MAGLLPAVLALLPAMAAQAGRLCWLGPVLALSAGLWLCRLWRQLGQEDLPRGLEAAFGAGLGKAAQLLYLLWGLFLLAVSARRFADRLLASIAGQQVQWLFLATALGLALWLGRGEGAVFARAGRLFFLAVAVALGFALLLALPALDWQNLWPPAREDWGGILKGGVLALSLSGYGIYALCLPRRPGGEEKTWPWAAWGCGIFSLLLLAVVGTFGPSLAAGMGEPFHFLLEGVKVPGAFRRGEAALEAVLGLADLTLLILLTLSCRILWKRLFPAGKGWDGAAVCAAAFCLAGALAGAGDLRRGMEELAPAGGLIFGVVLPGGAVLAGGRKKGQGANHTFCGKKLAESKDVE